MAPQSDLPGIVPSLRRALRLGYNAEPGLFRAALALSATAWLPTALTGLWLKLMVDGLVQHRQALVVFGAAALGVSVSGTWLLNRLNSRISSLLKLRSTVAIEAEVSRLQAEVVGIEHHERPEFLDRLQLLKEHIFLLDHLYGTFMGFVGLVLMLITTVGLLASIHPALVLLALFAVPAATSGSWRAGAERRAEDCAAPHNRLVRHLFDIATSAGSGKELRVTRNGAGVIRRRGAAWKAGYAELSKARWTSAFIYSAAWAVFGLAYAVALTLVALVLHRSAGSVVLALVAGGSLARYLGMGLSEAQFLRWTLDAAGRLAWLEEYARRHTERADQPAPHRIARGLRFENVSFTYPGTERPVLDAVSFDVPAGAVVALVGENGAGKSTLVKLMCRFYEPTSGRVLIDDLDLTRILAADWRARIGGAFQDFMRFEFRAQRNVGLGDQPREADLVAVRAAVARGGAEAVVDKLPDGLETQLGSNWPGGSDLSYGQWQKLALARGFMREDPLLLILDEPTSALDAETEHALFERFAAESKAGSAEGRVTVLVSHRFSTVRMADLIVVVDGSHVIEVGSHDQLMTRGGLYAELYGIQARAYR